MLSRPAAPLYQPGTGPKAVGKPLSVSAATQPAVADPARKIFFFFGVVVVFIRVSMVHQILTQKLGVNTYLLYIFGIPAMLGLVSGGGLGRVYKKSPGIWWSLFALWLLLAVPFSTWRGGAAAVVTTYLRTDLLMLFVVAGLVVVWSSLKGLMLTIATAGLANLVSAKFFSQVDGNERMGLAFGTIANPNDFAGHLLFVLPFVLWVVLISRTWVVKALGLLVLAYGMYLVMASASRGAALGIAAGLIFYLLATTQRQRLVMIVLAPVLLIFLLTLLPGRARERILSFSTTSESGSEEAKLSSISRSYLLRKSIEFTFHRPIFGVGAGQFSGYEGRTSTESGQQASWHETHNSFTQISSENGIPGLLLYLGGIGSTWLLLKRIHKSARKRPDMNEVAATALCLRLSMVSFCVAIFFLNFGYFFYLPMLAGLSIALSNVVEAEFENQPLTQAAPAVRPNHFRARSTAWAGGIKRFR
jgi:O-antigen ligase